MTGHAGRLAAVAVRRLPDPVRARLDGVRARATLRRSGIRWLTHAWVDRHGLTVRHGPFAGLRFLPEEVGRSGDLVAKLAGTYERELHPALEDWLADDPRLVVDVGAAERFYAVGIARSRPEARVVAFDRDRAARRRCRRTAALNGVADRVEVRGECTTAELDRLARRGARILLDCEGCELELLRPDRARGLATARILVELHDFIDPSTTATVVERLQATHDVELIPARSRRDVVPEELAGVDPGLRERALSELRPAGMRWAYARPRAA